MQVLIIGREGQLGSTFFEYSQTKSPLQFTFSTLSELDLSSEASVTRFFAGKHFDFIVNCAAYTAVDKAETDVDKAFLLNAKALTYIGTAAAQMGAKVIHISTDYVFNGQNFKPLKPEDQPNPLSVYGKSKLEGETNLLRAHPDSLIIRTAWLYSKYGENFVKTMLKLADQHDQVNVVADQIGSPCHAADLAKAILTIMEGIASGKHVFSPGIYHFANEGVCSWYDFATAIFQIAKKACVVNPVGSERFPRPAPRPWYSVLDKTKIKDTYGITIPHWRVSLEKCLSQMIP